MRSGSEVSRRVNELGVRVRTTGDRASCSSSPCHGIGPSVALVLLLDLRRPQRAIIRLQLLNRPSLHVVRNLQLGLDRYEGLIEDGTFGLLGGLFDASVHPVAIVHDGSDAGILELLADVFPYFAIFKEGEAT
jgi:hypothetical protein